MNYGIPYQGSKSKIVKKVISRLPKANHFYDLFGGGFSITHAMLLHRANDYKEFHFNEIRPGLVDFIQDAIKGKYSYENFKPEFITRERFFKEKESNPYIKILWSFGNNGLNYLFSKDIEKQKESLHNAVVFNYFDDYAKKIFGFDSFQGLDSIKERRLYLRTKIKDYQLQQLERLEQLGQLERLSKFNLISVKYSQLSYQDVLIKKNSIIYCDIPYRNTGEYDKNKNFNHDEFYDWADNQKEPVFISEFSMPDERFKQVFNTDKRSLMGGGKTKSRPKEKMYTNKAGFNALIKQSLKKQS